MLATFPVQDTAVQCTDCLKILDQHIDVKTIKDKGILAFNLISLSDYNFLLVWSSPPAPRQKNKRGIYFYDQFILKSLSVLFIFF